MPSEDPAQFPDFPHFAEDNYHEISAGTLREMIRRTVVRHGRRRPSATRMTGVVWELEGDKARLVATDGRRLALAEGVADRHGRPHDQGPDAGGADQGDGAARAQPGRRPRGDGQGLLPAQRGAVPHRAGGRSTAGWSRGGSRTRRK